MSITFCRLFFRSKTVVTLLLLIVGTGGLVGCDDSRPSRVSVSGHVVVDGKPLTYGDIRLISEGAGRPAMTKINSDGSFDFGDRGVVLGKNRVEVIASEQVSDTEIRWHAPEKYAHDGPTVEILDSKNDLVIELTWDGGKPFTARVPASFNEKGR